jgi:uncharacterized protein YneF (UPF0154 family)
MDKVGIFDALNDRQLIAANALLAGHTQQSAAEMAGVGLASVKRWLATDSDFREYLNACRIGVVAGLLAGMAGELHSAWVGIRDIANDTENNPSVRLKAFQLMLSAFGEYDERYNIDAKIAEIEANLEAKNDPN